MTADMPIILTPAAPPPRDDDCACAATVTVRVEFDEAERLAANDEPFATERADAFNWHCAHHNADFEVCSVPRCRAVVVEEVRRGLLDPNDVWPRVEMVTQ